MLQFPETVSARAERYYGLSPAEVIYPPVDTDVFAPGRGTPPADFGPTGIFLAGFAARLVQARGPGG
jgi:hypothetical protein